MAFVEIEDEGSGELRRTGNERRVVAGFCSARRREKGAVRFIIDYRDNRDNLNAKRDVIPYDAWVASLKVNSYASCLTHMDRKG